MSDFIDNVSQHLENAVHCIEEHPWQAAASVAAWAIGGPIVAAEVALVAKAALPVLTIGEAAAVAAAGGAVAGAALGAEGVLGVGLAGGGLAVAIKAAEAVAKGAAQAPKPATTQPAGH